MCAYRISVERWPCDEWLRDSINKLFKEASSQLQHLAVGDSNLLFEGKDLVVGVNKHSRVVGFLVVGLAKSAARMKWSRPFDCNKVPGGWNANALELSTLQPAKENLPIIQLVYVSLRERRRGLGMRMVEELANSLGREVTDLCWYAPFTPEAEALARKASPKEIWIGVPRSR